MTIRVTRSKHHAGLQRLQIWIDGKEVARLGTRESVDFEGSGKPHSLEAWFKGTASEPVTVADPGPGQLLLVTVDVPVMLGGRGAFSQGDPYSQIEVTVTSET